MVGIAQRRRLGVYCVSLLAGVRSPEDVQSLRIGGHDAVCDAVVDHFDKMAGAVRTAMEIAEFGCRGRALAARGSRNGARTRCKRLEDRIERLHRGVGPADHHAIAALKPPYAAAGADV